MSASSVSSARQAASRRSAASRAPRRVSGPVAGRSRARLAPQPTPTLGARALAVVRSLPEHSLLDRLVRGRAWIPLLGVLLTGLVAMQVEILKLGTSLGRSLERTTTLQIQNESLQARVATLSDDQRIERLATGMGMVMPMPGLLTFVPAHSQSQLRKAIANIQAPDPSSFAAQLAAQSATAALITPQTPAAPTGTTQATASSGGPGTGTTTGGAVSRQTETAASSTGVATDAAPSVTTTSDTPATTTGTAPVTTVSTGPGTTAPPASTDSGAAGLAATSGTGSSPGG